MCRDQRTFEVGQRGYAHPEYHVGSGTGLGMGLTRQGCDGLAEKCLPAMEPTIVSGKTSRIHIDRSNSYLC